MNLRLGSIGAPNAVIHGENLEIGMIQVLRDFDQLTQDLKPNLLTFFEIYT